LDRLELHNDIDRIIALANELADRGWVNDNDKQMRAAERLYQLAEDQLTLGWEVTREALSAALLMTDEEVQTNEQD